jgi:hypothetical protein
MTKGKLDMLTIFSAIGVAAYAAVAIRYVARYDLGFSFEEIRGAAMVSAVVIVAPIAIDFFGGRLGKSK